MPSRKHRPVPQRASAAAALLLLALAQAGIAQTGGRSREETWPAPTAEDWARPCLVTFQRTFEDALAVARETGKPLLVCVNMDGEIASEHYAGIRYREPATAALYEPYVCVIASVYRHTPRDFDRAGRRILCPRFGSVTCGEHIAIEPGLYERFLDGQRVAPRHIGVELDGGEMYDVYYAFDTESVFAAIQGGVAGRDTGPEPPRADRPLSERVASAHVEDREAVEQAYLDGNAAERRRLLEASLALGPEVSVDLLRLAIFGLDTELARAARRGLAQAGSAKAVPLIAEALRDPLSAEERAELLAALDRLGAAEPRARAVAVVHRGLEKGSEALDLGPWTEGLAAAGGGRSAGEELALAGDALAEAPGDLGAELDFGLAAVAAALETRDERQARLLCEDGARALARAEAEGIADWRAAGLRALLALRDEQWSDAQEHAAAALQGLPAGEPSAAAMRLVELFARGRQRAIGRAYLDGAPLDPAWIADVHAAYEVLARHPHGTPEQAAMHFDFLRWFGAGAVADAVLDRALARFPEAFPLHDRLRARILNERGAEGLEAAYVEVLERAGASPNLEWFAGYTAIVSAEFHRRGSRPAEARAAYERALEHFAASARANPETEATSAHYRALALAGRARLELEAGELERALEDLEACFAASPASASALDGLNVTPVGTAQMLHARLTALDRTEEAERLGAALARLDPLHLELPAFERGGPPSRQRSWPPPGR
jgi:hypothetical protein